jgi:hypothetical protein
MWIYYQSDPDRYTLLSKIPTALGAGTAGYFGRQRRDSTAFTWRFRQVPARAPRSESIPCRTEDVKSQDSEDSSCGHSESTAGVFPARLGSRLRGTLS